MAFLAAQVEREQARASADAAEQRALDSSQAQLRSVLSRMNERLREGALLEPLDDSAASLFRDARKIAPEDPAVLNARDALVAAMLTSADQNLLAGKLDDARQLVNLAARLHPRAPGLDLIRRRISEATAARSTAPAAPRTTPSLAAVSLPPPNPVEPAPVSTPAPSPVAPAPVAQAPEAAPAAAASTAVLKVVRRVEPKYPQQAWDQQVSGWVDLEFTVATDGSTRDVRVVASEPARVFDSAAVTAMRRYRYEPVVRDGSPLELRARMRIRFTADQGKD